MTELNASTEETNLSDSLGHAGFFRRLAGFLVDTLILVAVVGSFLWFFTYVYDYTFKSDYEIQDLAPLIDFVLLILAWGGYYIYFEGSHGSATPGKRLLHMQVCDRTGASVDYRRAALRFIGRVISTVIFGIGFLVSVFNRQRRTLHDFIAGTIVLKK